MADGARVVWMPGRVRTEVHLAAEDTGGAFCMLVDHPPAGWSLPRHRHLREAETIHVVEGEFEMEIDGERSRLTAGQTVHVPKGVMHAGANVGQGPGRRVLLFSPAGLERFFLEVGAPTPEQDVDAAAALTLAKSLGWEFAERG
ncbi:MAG TPA: cupin domain-containing protein [Solirubrobacteraceae bacterium]|jgi:quercetin dioxygenase-like cupin family protein|nr:cupin domain-containing protein [Solirubrobacteraceae bacterium]